MASVTALDVIGFAVFRGGLLSSSLCAMPENYANRRGSDAEDSDEDLFAELEAEIENADNAAVRERGMEQLRKE